MELTEQQRNTYLRRISHILLINGGFMDNPGLYTGEMGLALFFFRYAHYTQNGLFAQYGFDLVDKAQSRIHAGTPIDYKQGLTGLGSVLEYLVQCGYIKADTDAILEEFDRKLFDLENLPSLSLEDLFGIGYYALWRMTGASKLKYRILKTVLPALVSSMVEKNKNFSSSCPTVRVIKELIETENLKGLKTNTPLPASLRLCRHAYPYGLAEQTRNRFIEELLQGDLSYTNSDSLGLQNGLAGLGMSLMTESDGDDSWVYLLHSNLN